MNEVDLYTATALDLDAETPIFNRLLEQWRIGIVAAPRAINRASGPALPSASVPVAPLV